jgi:hypothetical protein
VRVIAARGERDTANIGVKYQRMLDAATADYVSVCADDALLHPQYVELIHDALQSDPDCVGFMLQIGARPPQPHSIAFRDVPGLQPWGPLVCDLGTWMPVRRSIGSRVRFEAGDSDEGWTRGVLATGLLRREVYISEVLVVAQVLDQGFHGHWEPAEPTPNPERPFVTYV